MRCPFRAALFAGSLQFLTFQVSVSSTAMIDSLLHQARQKFAPDRRTMVFNVTGHLEEGTLILSGEVHDVALHDSLMAFVRSRVSHPLKDSVTVLPRADLGEYVYGVVHVSVGNIRGAPAQSAELVNQALLGSPLRVLKKEQSWYFIQSPDDYLGWMEDGFQLMDRKQFEHWDNLPKLIVTVAYGFTREAPVASGGVVSDVVVGAILALEEEAGEFYRVAYPDGRTGYLPKHDAQRVTQWLEEAEATPERIVATAQRFTGIPYLWGGTSAKGFDCSGLTKTVYFLNGLLLPRDAGQQAAVGDPVDSSSDFSHVRAGDLLFFGSDATGTKGRRVTHVGISLGGHEFISASGNPGYVLINSLRPSHPAYSEHRRETFLFVRRIIGAGEQSGVRRVSTLSHFHGSKP